MIHSHPPVPNMEFFEEVRIDLEQIDCRRVRQTYQFHEAKQHKQVVKFHELFAQLLLVAGQGHPVKELTDVLPNLSPVHGRIISLVMNSLEDTVGESQLPMCVRRKFIHEPGPDIGTPENDLHRRVEHLFMKVRWHVCEE